MSLPSIDLPLPELTPAEPHLCPPHAARILGVVGPGGIPPWHPLSGFLAEVRVRSQRLVVANGCFDLLGVHHVRLLAFAKQQGEVLLVLVNNDASVTAHKGPTRPLVPLADRLVKLAQLRSVDAVVAFSEPTPETLLEGIRPHVLVRGLAADQQPYPVAGAQHCGRLCWFAYVPGASTTALAQRLHNVE